MNVHVILPEELTPQQIQLWSGMMRPETVTDGPFFHPEYVITLGRFRESVRIAVITENNREVAFFPFEKHGRTGKPLGIKLCDFQGVIHAPEYPVNMRELLGMCQLTQWQFDHVTADSPEYKEWLLRTEASPYIDLSDGFDSYCTQKKEAGSQIIRNTNKTRRKIDREAEPTRFEWHSTERNVFETLLKWKSAQREQTGTFDVTQFEWVTQLLDRLRNSKSDDFGGNLSALYSGDTLIAASLGLRTRTVLHRWFSSYNVNFSRYSPGSLLMIATIKAAAERGIRRIDMGRGDEAFKQRWGSGTILIGEGAVDLNPVRRTTRDIGYRTFLRIRKSGLYDTLQKPKRVVRYWIQKKRMKRV